MTSFTPATPAVATAAPDRRSLAPVARRADQCYCQSDPTYLEADQALRDEWAAVCRIRADLPPLGDDAAVAAMSDQLGLVDDERRAFVAAVAELGAIGEGRLREIYVTATGDEAGAPKLDPSALVEEIVRSAPLEDEPRIRQLLSAERAGHRPPVTDPQRMTPLEEFYRLLIGAGDEFEQHLGRRLGAGRARELRRRFGGWPGTGLDWIGCP